MLKYRKILPFVVVGYLALFYLGFKVTIVVGSINIYAWDILFLLCVINLIYLFFIEKIKLDASTKKIVVLLLLYLAYLELSEIYNFWFSDRHRIDDLIRTSIKALYPLVILTVLFNLDKEDTKKFFLFVACCAVVIAGWTTIKEIFDIGTGFKTSSGTIRRMRGEAIIVIQMGVLYFLYTNASRSIFKFSAIVILLAAIALTAHRSGFLSIGFIFIAYTFYAIKSRRIGKLLYVATPILSLGGIVLLGVIFFGKSEAISGFFTRAADTFNTENKTSEGRLFKWEWALRSTLDNPIGGTKMNLLPNWYGTYSLQADYGYLSIGEAHGRYIFREGDIDPWPPHNMFINMVSLNGVTALILYLIFITAVVKQMVKESTQEELFFKSSTMIATFIFLFFNNHHSYDAALGLFIATLLVPLLYKIDSEVGQEESSSILPVAKG